MYDEFYFQQYFLFIKQNENLQHFLQIKKISQTVPSEFVPTDSEVIYTYQIYNKHDVHQD